MNAEEVNADVIREARAGGTIPDTDLADLFVADLSGADLTDTDLADYWKDQER